MKSEKQLKVESNARTVCRVIFGISSGVVVSLFLSWIWLFILIGGYCFVEFLFLFSIVMRSETLKTALGNPGKVLSDKDKGEIIGHAIGYSTVQFFISFAIIFVIGLISKLVTGLF